MRVIISDHAYDRFRERTIINENKYQKVAEKAWRSNQVGSKRIKFKLYIKKTENRNSIFKEYNGKIFVFNVMQNANCEVVAVLTTIYNN